MTTGETGGPGLGSAAEEASRLFAALQDWARQTGDDLGEHIATDAPECSLCPVCRGISVMRSLSPEVYQHLSAAADSLAEAVKAAVAAHERDWSSRRSGPVEHIDIG